MQTILLNQDKFRFPSAVYAIVGDESVPIKMRVTDVTYSAGTDGTVHYTEPDGTYGSIGILSFDPTDNSFEVDLSQASTKTGKVKCVLVVDDNDVSAYPFLLFVRSTPRLHI